jgi:D-3-phosphoglycerate dehydrogenase
MSVQILITDFGFKHVELERAAVAAAGLVLKTAQCRTPGEVIEAAAEAEVLIVQWAPISAEVIAALPRLRAIIRYGIGVDNIDLAAATERNVAVCNIPDYCIDEVADHTVALALSLARQLPQTHVRTLGGQWKITPPAPMPAFREMTFACAGFGRIARAVLTRASGFGFRLAAYDPYVPPAVFAGHSVRPLTVTELLESADILSLHLPLSTQTKHFLNAERIETLRRSALLINTSRGGLVDTMALADALTRGRLAGAGLDVFEMEPLPDEHPLRQAPNTILTSHTAWFSEASVPRLQRLAAEEAIRAARREPLRSQINKTPFR